MRAAAADDEGAAGIKKKEEEASNDKQTPTMGRFVGWEQLTSLGGVSVPSTSNRHRMFLSEEKLFKFSISSQISPLYSSFHLGFKWEVQSCAARRISHEEKLHLGVQIVL